MKTLIPRTIEEARAELDGIGVLLTAKEWERAAIVYAFTRDGGAGGATAENRSSSTTVPMTPRQFAALGISGLASDSTVRNYRKAWQSAIDDRQAEAVKPGDVAQLPTRPWKEVFGETTADVQDRVFRSVLRDPVRLAVAMEDPDVAAAVHDVVAADVHHVHEVNVRARQKDAEVVRDYLPAQPYEADYSADLRHAVNGLLRVLGAMRDGRWSPDTMERTLLQFLHQAFAEIADEQKAGSYNVLDEIEAFLVTQR